MLLCLPSVARSDEVPTPNFWDQRQRLGRPEVNERPRIRFLTSVDYPPFNFLDGSGRLTGFNVDLVRMLCAELDALDRCQIEAKPFDQLVPALLRGEADAIAAGVAVTPESRRDLAFTQSYFRYPARFVVRRDAPLAEPVGDRVAGLRVGVVRGSAHAAMLSAFFPKAVKVEFDGRDVALEALKRKEVAAVFGEGVSLSFWLDSDAAKECCAFAGGPYLSERFLGEGLAVAVARKDRDLAQALDYALGQVVAKKGFSELMLRYFPTSAF
ncbi:transporter substrate-binding domain-containing protein [Aureimonas leprariae]|uniref:transporter substrate-binding domain-containing protein n=1 Tax=Plantimonas leprariae TaxID=2615207 RepID=UPI001FE5230F|nr:transporter substrate-binding domain-containing protein [Aureimonas leprariae]